MGEATEVGETTEKKEETENNEKSEVKPDEGSKKELQETPQEVQNNESSNVEEKAESQVVVTKDSVIDQTQQEPTGEVFNKNNEPPKSEKEVFEAKKWTKMVKQFKIQPKMNKRNNRNLYNIVQLLNFVDYDSPVFRIKNLKQVLI